MVTTPGEIAGVVPPISCETVVAPAIVPDILALDYGKAETETKNTQKAK